MSFPIAPASAALIFLCALPGAALAQSQNMPDMDMSGMDMDDPSPSAWHIHSHTTLSLVSDSQSGPRGGDKTFVAGMTMLMAGRSLDADNDLELEAMLSPDAFMGKSGYPLLLQTGETADGATPLRDRQHPHDLFMGLTATLTHRFSGQVSGFVTAGYPGEFAFGPTAFMHRASGEDFPTAPISHHWLDSGHITFGVLTAGLRDGPITLEISQFTGREPDQYRFDFDPAHLDSTAVRLSWQVTAKLKAQASWARQVSPEALEPDINLRKSSLSLEYSRKLGTLGVWTSTLAFGRKQVEHGADKPSDAILFENAWQVTPRWTVLGRFERVYSDELAAQPYWVAKTELGGMRTFAINDNASLSLGLMRQFNAIPDGLKSVYGSNPTGTVAFMTLKLHAMKM